MALRPIKLPGDFKALSELIGESFQYPENEAWSVQTDEKEQLGDTLSNLSQLWPLIRLSQLLSPTLRGLLLGYVWVEDDKPVGTTIIQRRGSTNVWEIDTVAVLPLYRRRGIAHQLVEAAIDLIREQGGERVILNVIDGNMPAFTLYESLGFEHFSSTIEYHSIPEKLPLAPEPLQSYRLSPVKRFDWQPRYELDKRITPEQLQRFEPIEVGRYRQPAMMRLLDPLLSSSQGVHDEYFIMRTTPGEAAVARGGCSTPTNGKGSNQIWLHLDPEHRELAYTLVCYLMHKVVKSSPGFRVQFSVRCWMKSVMYAAELVGFEKRLTYCRMGLMLE